MDLFNSPIINFRDRHAIWGSLVGQLYLDENIKRSDREIQATKTFRKFNGHMVFLRVRRLLEQIQDMFSDWGYGN